MQVQRGEQFIQFPTLLNLCVTFVKAHRARRSLNLLFGKCHLNAGSSYVSQLSVTQAVLAFNPVEFQRE